MIEIYFSKKELLANIDEFTNDFKSSFFTSLTWYENLIDTVVKIDKNTAGFIVGNIDENTSILFPFIYEKYNNGLRVLKGLCNYYTPIFEILIRRSVNNDPGLLVNFFSDIKDCQLDWDVMEFRPLAVDDSKYIINELKNCQIPAFSFFCFGNWYLNVNGRTFDEYFSSLSSKTRNTVKRKSSRFEKQNGAMITILTKDEMDLDEAINAYIKVYNSSWKKEEPYPHFLPGLIRLSSNENSLRLGLAFLDGEPIAVQLWIVADNTAYIFKLAYDEKYKALSAGTILTSKLMKYVIDIDKVQTVDYLCGDDAYKKDWMSNRRERWGIIAFNTRTLRGSFEFGKELFKRSTKKVLSKII